MMVAAKAADYPRSILLLVFWDGMVIGSRFLLMATIGTGSMTNWGEEGPSNVHLISASSLIGTRWPMGHVLSCCAATARPKQGGTAERSRDMMETSRELINLVHVLMSPLCKL